jgi:hypothetical protein
MEDFAYMGRWRYNPRKQNYNDESIEEQEDSMDDYLSSIH